MNKTVRIFIIVTVILSFFMVPSCSKPSKEGSAIEVGVILPLTGPIAMGGKRVLDGIKLAVEDFNSKNETKIELKIEDSQAQPSIGINAINKLIQIENVKFIIGDLISGVTLAIAPIAEKNKVLLLAPGASNPAVRDAGDYIFRNWTSDDFDGMVAASYVNNELLKKKTVVLYIQNDYGVGLKSSFEEKYKEIGGAIVHSEGFSQGQNDFRSIIAKMKDVDFDLIYIAGQPREMGHLIKQLKEYGVNSTIFSNTSVEEKDFQTIAGKSAVEIFYTSPAFDLTSDNNIVRNFVKQYKEKYNEEADIASAHGYDAAIMLIHCIKNGYIDSESVKTCLYNTKDFQGVTGKISFDKYGDAIKGLLVKKLGKAGDVEILCYFKPY